MSMFQHPRFCMWRGRLVPPRQPHFLFFGLLTFTVMLGLAALASAADQQGAVDPSDLRTLKALEQNVQAAAENVVRSVVAVRGARTAAPSRHYEPFGSGVIITPDGLVLSQFHVSHALGDRDEDHHLPSGHRVAVRLHDGREVEAELLGADRTHDLSLLQLVEDGPYPHTPLQDHAVELADWVLKLGHPEGHRTGRLPVVRLGRVVQRQGNLFITDCQIGFGDSGGPFFDLQGRLVGLVRDSQGTDLVRQFIDLSLAPRHELFFTANANALILERLPSMQNGLITPIDHAGRQRVVDELAGAARLPAARWTQARGWAAAVGGGDMVAHSVVSIRDGDRAVTLGTIVGADGWVLTKASELPFEPICSLADGRVLPAEVVGVDTAFDLALLKVEAADLPSVVWAEASAEKVGALVAAVGPGGPVAMGIISVKKRQLPGPYPQGIEAHRARPAALPELIGSTVQGRGYWIEYAKGRAAAAGVQPGDVITQISGHAVRNHADLSDSIAGRRAGERVSVELLRAGRALELDLELRGEGQPLYSRRRDDFPVVFESDMPLLPQECGGPIVDLDGKAVGVAIARIGLHGSNAVPADVIRDLLPALKEGQGLAAWHAYRATLDSTKPRVDKERPQDAPLSDLSIDELRQHLTDRRGLFSHLLVEYEVLIEPHVEPRLLMEWNLSHQRDARERHRIARSDGKRYVRVVQPHGSPLWAPQDQVHAPSGAPPEVARAAERRRQAAERARLEGRLSHLFAPRGAEQFAIYDGQNCYVRDLSDGQVRRRPSDWYYEPIMYLASQGLRPVDPNPQPAQNRYDFPDNFDLYDKLRILDSRPTSCSTAALNASRSPTLAWLALPTMAALPRRV